MTAQDIDPLARSGPGAGSECSDPAPLSVFIDDGSDAGAWETALSYAPYRRIADGVWTNGFTPLHSSGLADD